ncbi:MAG: DEAD/DEAH box helicase [Candidatus Sericytochromatia bacterium]
MLFSQFDFDARLLKGIQEQGYTQPTPIQAQTIPLLLANHDVIGCAQTGTGKTAAFALPILQGIQSQGRQPQALIITPTRELAEQIDQNIKAYARYLKIRCQSVYGGVKAGPQESALRRGVDIVVATPGRLLDHLNNRVFKLEDVRYLVLDEADRMLDMGFLPDIKRILAKVPSERQTLLFSATMPAEIEKLAKSMTRNPRMVMVAPRSTTAERVEQALYKVEKTEKLRLLMHLLEDPSLQSVIVFSRTRHGADRIARQLERRSGVAVARIHADRSQAQRQKALDGFKSGEYRVLVATDIAARGIDVDGISHVINYDTPVQAEDYVHRIGRTGRADASGEAWTFSSSEEAKYLASIEKLLGRKLPVVDRAHYAVALATELPDLALTSQRTSSSVAPRAPKAAQPPRAEGRSARPAGSATQKRTEEATRRGRNSVSSTGRSARSASASARPARKPSDPSDPGRVARSTRVRSELRPEAFSAPTGGVNPYNATPIATSRNSKRAKNSYPLGGDVDYIEEDERPSSDVRQRPGRTGQGRTFQARRG